MSRERIEAAITSCAALAAAFAETAEADDRDGRFPREKAERVRAAGISAFTVPEEFGGMGAGVWDMCRALLVLSEGDPSVALGVAMHVHAMGSAAQQRNWRNAAFAALCAECVSPGIFVNSVHSEPEMGSPSRGGLPATRATRVAGGYEINGQKRWATFAPALDYFLISAAIETPEGPTSGVFAVRAPAAGLKLIDRWSDGLSLRASGSFDVILDGVFVPEARQIDLRTPGNPPKAGYPAAWGPCAFGSVYLGIGKAAIKRLAMFARSRVPTALGKPIAELPAVQRAAGQMSLRLRAAELALRDTAVRWDTEPEHRARMAADIAAAKYTCVEAAIATTELAMRAAGASALDRGLGLERLFRDARAGLMQPPQEDLALEIIGRAALEA
jgi:alkylation response protein AidB-like acyl-CoA dehydrogenase